MRARPLGDRGLARQKSAEILETDTGGQQRNGQRADASARKSALTKSQPSMPTQNWPHFAHANTATKKWPCLPPDWRQCDKIFYGLINLAKLLTAQALAMTS